MRLKGARPGYLPDIEMLTVFSNHFKQKHNKDGFNINVHYVILYSVEQSEVKRHIGEVHVWVKNPCKNCDVEFLKKSKSYN